MTLDSLLILLLLPKHTPIEGRLSNKSKTNSEEEQEEVPQFQLVLNGRDELENFRNKTQKLLLHRGCQLALAKQEAPINDKFG